MKKRVVCPIVDIGDVSRGDKRVQKWTSSKCGYKVMSQEETRGSKGPSVDIR